MQNSINIKNLLDFKTRVWIYLLSFCSIIFLQTFCTNVCPFIDGLQHDKLFRNLFIVFLLQLIYREFLYTFFNESKKNLSIPRQAYFLSIISWVLAGLSAFILHNILYPDFPMSSHFRIFSSYLTLGAAILAQLEYIIFEKRYKELSKDIVFTIFNEKISQRIIETFLIFTITPIITILLIIGRYNQYKVIDSQVTLEVFYIGLLLIISAVILAIAFGKILKEDTKIIINNIQNIENGKYENTSIINRPDELGEISYAMRNMSSSIKDGINEKRRYIWDLFGNIEHCISALIYISGNEIVCENEVGVHFRTVYNKDNMFIFSFLCLWHDFG